MARRMLSPLWLLWSLLAASGCTSHVTGQVDGPVDYRVTGGFSGVGDGTALLVELDGTVTRKTVEHGPQTAMLDLESLDDLHQKILDAQFAMLAPQYHCTCADDFVDSVSVHVDNTAYTVEADRMASVPERLKAAIDTLKDIHQRPLDWH